MKIVLASSSIYRKELLKNIIPNFETCAANIDESRHTQEPFEELASRLAYEKAKAVSRNFPNSLIIGSDQVAHLGTLQLSKPITASNTILQLKECQGKDVHFHTGICLFNSTNNTFQCSVETYRTKFRTLSKEQIERYVEKEPAFDCAGGFKMEGLGIALFERITGEDPNILIGLPMIRLVSMLASEGYHVL